MTLAFLHYVLQIAMGWEDCHMHQFIAGAISYGERIGEDPSEMRDENAVGIGQLLRRPKDRLLYEYDFGDSWLHQVSLEIVLPPRPGGPLAECVTGRRRCPPEDSGGIGNYQHMLWRLSKAPGREEAKEFLSWVGGSFDPAAFDAAAVNRRLERLL